MNNDNDHPLVIKLSNFLEKEGFVAGLLIIPDGQSLRLVGTGISSEGIHNVTRSLVNYLNEVNAPRPEGKLN